MYISYIYVCMFVYDCMHAHIFVYIHICIYMLTKPQLAKGDAMSVNIGVAVQLTMDEGFDPPQVCLYSCSCRLYDTNQQIQLQRYVFCAMETNRYKLQLYSYIYIYIHIYTYIYIYINTHIYIYMCIYMFA